MKMKLKELQFFVAPQQLLSHHQSHGQTLVKKVWFKINPELLELIKEEIQSEYPNLHFNMENGIVFIRGSFPVSYKNKILDRYSIEIEFPFNYPDSIPTVREMGGRIPWTLDSHMLKDGRCCLFLPDAQGEVYPAGSSFLDFLNGPVHNFFLGQTLVSLGQPWPFGEQAHGIQGIFEYYADLVGTKDVYIIVNYIEYISKTNVKGHWLCPCGSGNCLRNCHLNLLIDLRKKILPQTAKKSLQIIQKLLENIHN